jgi:hypothetical protein
MSDIPTDSDVNYTLVSYQFEYSDRLRSQTDHICGKDLNLTILSLCSPQLVGLVTLCKSFTRAYLQPPKSMFLLTEFNLKLVLEPEIPPVVFTKLKLKSR